MSGSGFGSSHDDAGFRAVQRRLASRLPAARSFGDGVPLELRPSGPDQPRLVESQVVEGQGMRALRVAGAPEVRFAAFLDGTQRSEVLCYADGLPLIHGTVGAVVRVRHDHRMRTWPPGPVIGRSVYAPLALIDDAMRAELDALETVGVRVVDTTADGWMPDQGAHPASLLERAMSLVQRDRERAEQRLAEEWCARDGGLLFIDGGISGTDRVAGATCVAGVVKSHRTLHVPADGVAKLMRLARGERTSAFLVASTRRAAVLSWYLRLRDPAGRDPFFGLVRVEVAHEPAMQTNPARVFERAEEISRWVLAEVAPLALPDARWDKMVYGVRDCEEFLRAVC